MTEAIKLFSVILFIVILLRLKLDLGLVMFLSSILLGIIFQLGIYEIVKNIYLTMIKPETLQLIGIIVLVYVLSSILRRTKSMEGIISSLQNIVADYRLILFFIASFLGLIPMPAGAMFSAPLLKEVGKKNHMTSEEIMFFNYWFRHVWEFVWPLIPGVVLYASVIDVNLRTIMISQLPLSIIALSIGFYSMYTGLLRQNNDKINYQDLKSQISTLFRSVWSILLIIFLVLFFNVDLLISLSVTIVLLLMIHPMKAWEIKEIIFKDISLKVIMMIIGIMLFKQVLESTNSMNQIPQFFSEIGINVWIILFFIPFLLGFLTGITTGFIGISFPLLMPLMTHGGSLNLSMAMFAYLAGFSGMMISPMHLCMTVTLEYLQVNILNFYRKMSIQLFFFVSLSIFYIFFIIS